MPRKTINWSVTMDKFIMDNHPAMTYSQIAAALGLPYRDKLVSCRHYYLRNGGSITSHRYSISDYKYLIENYTILKITEMATHIGVSADTLRKKIVMIRQKSRRGAMLFPPKNKMELEEGVIVNRVDGQYIKKGGRWVRNSANPRPKRTANPRPKRKRRHEKKKPEVRRAKPVKNLVTKAVSRKSGYGKPTRPEPKLKLAAPDLTGKIAVKVDHKTTVYVSPGTDIEALKERYKRKIA